MTGSDCEPDIRHVDGGGHGDGREVASGLYHVAGSVILQLGNGIHRIDAIAHPAVPVVDRAGHLIGRRVQRQPPGDVRGSDRQAEYARDRQTDAIGIGRGLNHPAHGIVVGLRDRTRAVYRVNQLILVVVHIACDRAGGIGLRHDVVVEIVRVDRAQVEAARDRPPPECGARGRHTSTA